MLPFFPVLCGNEAQSAAFCPVINVGIVAQSVALSPWLFGRIGEYEAQRGASSSCFYHRFITSFDTFLPF